MYVYFAIFLKEGSKTIFEVVKMDILGRRRGGGSYDRVLTLQNV